MTIRMRLISSFASLHKSCLEAGLCTLVLAGFFVIGCNDQHSRPQPTGRSAESHVPPSATDAVRKIPADVAMPELTETEARTLAEAEARKLWKDWGCTTETTVQVLPVKLAPEDGGGWSVAVGFPGERPQDWAKFVVTPEREVLEHDAWFARMWESMSTEEREKGQRWLLERWRASPTPCPGPGESPPQTRQSEALGSDRDRKRGHP